MLIISWFKRSFLNYLHVVVQGMKEIRPGFNIIDLGDENGRSIQNPKCPKSNHNFVHDKSLGAVHILSNTGWGGGVFQIYYNIT